MTAASDSAVLIAGPTASGKTALAVSVAKRLNGVVINADSMQVYSDLDILSARPSEQERDGIEHLLFGHVDGAINYSAGKWLADVGAAIASVRASGRIPVIAGGTGLYFMALLQGLSQIPQVPEAVRARMRDSLEGQSAETMHARLASVDPLSAERIKSADRQRIERALEVFEATGTPLSAFQGRREGGALDGRRCIKVFLEPDRTMLRERIDRRFERMVEAGAVEEVRALARRGLDPALPVMRAHGAPGLLAFLAGAMSLEAAIEKGKGDTRRYAKRQFTWFRHQLPEFERCAPDAALALIEARAGSLEDLPARVLRTGQNL